MYQAPEDSIPYYNNDLLEKTSDFREIAHRILDAYGKVLLNHDPVVDCVIWRNPEIWTDYQLIRLNKEFYVPTHNNDIIKDVIELKVTEAFPDGQTVVSKYITTPKHGGFMKQFVSLRQEDIEKRERLAVDNKTRDTEILATKSMAGAGGIEHEMEILVDVLIRGLEILTSSEE